jgi:hypothetical protein
MKQLLLLIFALSLLCFVAAAQTTVTVTGLPQYGIALSSNQTPLLQIANSGSHAIAGIVLAVTYMHGGPPAPLKGFLVPGMVPADKAAHPLTIPMPGGDVSAIALDAVVLDNGTYVGPDVTRSFGEMQGAVADQASVSLPLVTAVSANDFDAAWTTIGNIGSKTPDESTSFPTIATARILLGQRAKKGDSAAINAAQKYVNLAPLTKGNSN